MLKKTTLLIVVLFIFQDSFGQQYCPVIPLPQQYEKVNGFFIIDEQTVIKVEEPSFSHAARFFKAQLLRYTGIPLSSRETKASVIILRRGQVSNGNKGGYHLSMESNKIVVTALNRKGAFNGMVTLLQLIMVSPKANQSIPVSCWDIEDYPLYTWRGFMLDESRHFFGKKVVKELLDQMALLKLNRFHWHLTDEPGWRIQIKKYPRLALVGGIGNHSDSLVSAKYYTQEDIREIVAYARARHIKVIPEIDMPGHATAANRAYPEYSGGGIGKYADFTFNPGKAATYQYLTNILKEVAVLFPSSMVHLGGDEVSFGSKSWSGDTGVQHLMAKEHLADLKAVEHYFLHRMADSSLRYFNKILAWDEAADARLPKENTIIFWWRHDKPEQLRKAMDKGYHVVLCPRIPLYFDFVQDSSHIDGRRWNGKFSSLKEVYLFSDHTYPVVEQAPPLILGIQANLWTETVQSERRLEFLLFPRIAALSEASWTSPDKRNYKGFLSRLKSQLLLYREEGIYYYDPFSPQKTPEVVDMD